MKALIKLFNKTVIVLASQYQKYSKTINRNNSQLLRYVLEKIIVINYPEENAKNNNFEVHSVICHKDVPTAIICLRSFLRFMGSDKLVIHGDGSLTKDDIKLLKKFFSNSNIIRFEDSQKIINKHFRNKFPFITKNRNRKLKRWHILTMLDIWLFSKCEKIIYLDSDILFQKKPTEIIQWTKNGSNNLYCKTNINNSMIKKNNFHIHCMNNEYEFVKKFNQKPIKFFNMGILCFNKKNINISDVETFLRKIWGTYANDNNYRDQTFWCLMYSQKLYKNIKELPFEKYYLPNADYEPIMKENHTSFHFISPIRDQIYKYLYIELYKYYLSNN